MPKNTDYRPFEQGTRSLQLVTSPIAQVAWGWANIPVAGLDAQVYKQVSKDEPYTGETDEGGEIVRSRRTIDHFSYHFPKGQDLRHPSTNEMIPLEKVFKDMAKVGMGTSNARVMWVKRSLQDDSTAYMKYEVHENRTHGISGFLGGNGFSSPYRMIATAVKEGFLELPPTVLTKAIELQQQLNSVQSQLLPIALGIGTDTIADILRQHMRGFFVETAFQTEGGNSYSSFGREEMRDIRFEWANTYTQEVGELLPAAEEIANAPPPTSLSRRVQDLREYFKKQNRILEGIPGILSCRKNHIGNIIAFLPK